MPWAWTCLLLLSVTGFTAQAGAMPSRALSLIDCVRLALEHNFEVKIERKSVEIARYQLSLAYGEYDPTVRASTVHGYSHASSDVDTNVPTTHADHVTAGFGGLLPTGLDYQFKGDLIDSSGTSAGKEFDTTAGSVSVELRQPLLKNAWIDTPRLNIQVNRSQLKISELAFRGQVMNIVTRVELAYYDLLLAREFVKVQEQALALAQELLAANRERIKQGVMAALDEKQAESQASSQRALLLAAQSAVGTQENVLKALLSDRIFEWQDVGIQPLTDLTATPQPVRREESWERALRQRPDFLQAREDLERLGYIVRFNRNQLFPQLDVVGSYGHAAAEREFSGAFGQISRGASPFYTYGLQMTIPLTLRKERENFRISRVEREQSALRLQQLQQNILLEIDDAVKVIETDFERVSTTRAAREFAEVALHAEQTRMDNGKGSSFVVLQLQRDLTTARSEEVRALADYNKALSQLALREGSVLDHYQLDLEVK